MNAFVTASSCVHGMQGKTLRVSFVGNPPYVKPDATGVDIEYADTVGDRMGFKREYFLETSRGTYLPEEKKFIGLLGSVISDNQWKARASVKLNK